MFTVVVNVQLAADFQPVDNSVIWYSVTSQEVAIFIYLFDFGF